MTNLQIIKKKKHQLPNLDFSVAFFFVWVIKFSHATFIFIILLSHTWQWESKIFKEVKFMILRIIKIEICINSPCCLCIVWLLVLMLADEGLVRGEIGNKCCVGFSFKTYH